MSLGARLARHSGVYTVANLLQRGTAFLLVPLYTHVMTPAEYGTLAVITALNGILVVLLPLSIHGAVTRFYFEYRDQPQVLHEFWGTVLAVMLVCCATLAALLLLFSAPLFDLLLGDVAFWPYVVLGIATSAVQPFFQMALTILQTRGQPVRYGLLSLGHFLVTMGLTLFLVLGLRWGPTGPLLALAVSSGLFALIGLGLLRNQFRLCFRADFARAAILYTVPHIPHGISSQLLVTTDRLLLNGLVSLATTGVYNIAALFTVAIDLLCQSVNRAYVPLSMAALKDRDPASLEELRQSGKTMVAGFVLIGATATIFCNEIIALAVGEAFQGAAAFVPFLAFAGVAGGIYYVLVNILFFDRHGNNFIPLGTAIGAAASIGLNFVMIRAYGAAGAAVATLGAQITTTIVIGAIGYRYELVRWSYGLFAVLFGLGFAASLALATMPSFGLVETFLARIAGWLALTALLSFATWRDPLYLIRLLGRILRSAGLGRSSGGALS